MMAAKKTTPIATLLATKAKDLIGGQLTDERRREIIAYLQNPAAGRADWEKIRGVLISENMRRGTLWQAVLYVDPKCPVADDGGYFPAPFTLARAIRAVLEPGEKKR
jgi:hypothetical protein